MRHNPFVLAPYTIHEKHIKCCVDAGYGNLRNVVPRTSYKYGHVFLVVSGEVMPRQFA